MRYKIIGVYICKTEIKTKMDVITYPLHSLDVGLANLRLWIKASGDRLFRSCSGSEIIVFRFTLCAQNSTKTAIWK